MTPSLIAAGVAALGAVLFAGWVYRRRELPIRGRERLALLRGGSLLLVLVLLLNPQLPGDGGERHRILVDASPSMTAALVAGGRPAEGVEASPTAEVTEGAVLERFGAEGDAAVTPVVARAIEAGVTRITLRTDGRIPDAVELRSLLQRAPVQFEVVDLGGPVRNAGVEAIRVPREVGAGEAATLPVTVFWEEMDAPIVVELRGSDGVLASDTVRPDRRRGRVELPLRITAPEEAGAHVLYASVSGIDDGFAADDRRGAVLEVDPDRGAVVLVSGSAGWETRFLAGTLAEVSGLPVLGFLAAGEDGRFLRTGGAPALVEREDVLRAVEDAALVVRHGSSGLDSAVVAAIASVDRRLLLDPAGGTGGAGEWYLSGDLPASPLAVELAGIPLLGLPPLGIRAGDDTGSGAARGAVPLRLQRDGTGDGVPALRLREEGGERVVDVLAEGWWRLALRPGDPATLYRRLWSAVTGWLLAGDGADLRTGIAPRAPVDRPEAEIEWDAAPAAGGRLAVEWSQEEAVVRVDTLTVSELGRARSAPLPAGEYGWRAVVVDGEAEGRERSGRILREGWSGDLALPRDADLSDLPSVAATPLAAGRPLRSTPWPWLLLLGLLSVEWIVRRRIGLR